MLKGTGVCPGIAMGRILLVKHVEVDIEKKTIDNFDAEKKRLLNAIEMARFDFNNIKTRAAKEFGDAEAQIFEAYLLILEDAEFVEAAINKIKDEKVNSEYALSQIRDMFAEMFESMDNEYMRERAADIRDVSNRVIRYTAGIEYCDLTSLKEEVVLVARDLTPSDTAVMDKEKVLGFLTDVGGRTSHTAIMARALEIPAVVGLKNITGLVKDGDYVIIDGGTGEVILNPNDMTIETFKKLRVDYMEKRKQYDTERGRQTITLDGRRIVLAGNIGMLSDIAGLVKNDAEGVGLFRTEFLYMNRSNLPNEEEQFKVYRQVLESVTPKPVVIRTLDIGGDKELPYLKIEKEMNPFLGYRAIRLCLDRKDIFKTQIRALFRASVYGDLKIMFPMISNLQEILEVKAIINDVKKELDNECIPYSKDIQIGIMIEVPSAAIISDILAKHVDFFSIGTNDLIQYTCAADRMNEKIHYLYNQFNPAVLRLIKLVIDNAHREGKWVGMCGESAGDKRMIPILIGMGIDELSMSPISILSARQLINSLSCEEMKKKSEDILKVETSERVEEYIQQSIEAVAFSTTQE